MRIGNSTSASYRRLHSRQRARRMHQAAHWCTRLDALVVEAESHKPDTKARKAFMARADKVREKLRKVDH